MRLEARLSDTPVDRSIASEVRCGSLSLDGTERTGTDGAVGLLYIG